MPGTCGVVASELAEEEVGVPASRRQGQRGDAGHPEATSLGAFEQGQDHLGGDRHEQEDERHEDRQSPKVVVLGHYRATEEQEKETAHEEHVTSATSLEQRDA